MKLRTSLTASHDGTLVDATDANLIADAACAHALMRAMRDAGDVVFYADDDYQRWVYDRADSILREWGFDSGEVE